MQRRVISIQRCGAAFHCQNAGCKTRVISGELLARVAVFPDRGFPTEERVCMVCCRGLQVGSGAPAPKEE